MVKHPKEGVHAMAVETLDTEAAFTPHVLHKKGLVIVDFWAPWCEGGGAIVREIEGAAAACTPPAAVLRVNVDQFPGLAAAYDITAVPTLLFFKDGHPLKRIIGYTTQCELEKFLSTLE